jgi:hypothetical protein
VRLTAIPENLKSPVLRISLTHPDFREDLERQAHESG